MTRRLAPSVAQGGLGALHGPLEDATDRPVCRTLEYALLRVAVRRSRGSQVDQHRADDGIHGHAPAVAVLRPADADAAGQHVDVAPLDAFLL